MSVFVVLVVDDDRIARKQTVAALDGTGCRVLAARNGGEALALLERHPGIDLILTEVVMPGIGGFMLADIARLRRPEIKVLYVSGFREIAELKVERLAGALVPKPLAPETLRAAVRDALGADPPAASQPSAPGGAAPQPPTRRSPSLGF
jgi:CheY-like chemotaxis protein